MRAVPATPPSAISSKGVARLLEGCCAGACLPPPTGGGVTGHVLGGVTGSACRKSFDDESTCAAPVLRETHGGQFNRLEGTSKSWRKRDNLISRILSPNMSRMLILLTLALATVVHGFEPAVGAVCAEWCIHEPPMVWATTPDCTGCTAHDLPCLDWYDCPSPTPLTSSQGGVPPATGVFTERSLH
jgi:hypothetical protein